jgi:hypothetical protein
VRKDIRAKTTLAELTKSPTNLPEPDFGIQVKNEKSSNKQVRAAYWNKPLNIFIHSEKFSSHT